MENQPHQEEDQEEDYSPNKGYRGELADKLKEIRNSDPENPEVAKARAKGYLEAKKDTLPSLYNYSHHEKWYRKSPYFGALNEFNKYLCKQQFYQDFRKEDRFLDSGLPMKINEMDLGKDGEKTIFICPNSGMSPDKLADSIIEYKDLIPKKLQDVKLAVGATGKTPYNWGTRIDIFYDKDLKIWKSNKYEIPTFSNGGGIMSSLRFKEELQPIENTIKKINKLRGVSFKWKSNEDSPREIGVIAEEVVKVFPELVFLDQKGKPLGVHYDKFVAVLIEAVKDLDKRVKDLEK